jgi:hypothetical protein
MTPSPFSSQEMGFFLPFVSAVISHNPPQSLHTQIRATMLIFINTIRACPLGAIRRVNTRIEIVRETCNCLLLKFPGSNRILDVMWNISP